MAGNKTMPTQQRPIDFLSAVEPQSRRDDGLAILDFFNRVTGWQPFMWGASIIGYGRYAYKYESGRKGEFFITGFSPRKAGLTIYIMPGYRNMLEKLARLGKHKVGKSCVYINKLADIDMDVLEEMVRDGIGYMEANYETWPE